MVIKRTDIFKQQFRDISFYIAKDKPSASKSFRTNLNHSINNLINFPYKFRQSFYHNDENIRDMIFNGYCIIYRINKQQNTIEILEIFNQNPPKREI